tara:strand:+ start:2272 stop:2517 length:246 start_codon:yes stop_codon:yes gene_type:complete
MFIWALLFAHTCQVLDTKSSLVLRLAGSQKVGLSAISFCEAVPNLLWDLVININPVSNNSFSIQNLAQRMPLQSLTRASLQ